MITRITHDLAPQRRGTRSGVSDPVPRKQTIHAIEYQPGCNGMCPVTCATLCRGSHPLAHVAPQERVRSLTGFSSSKLQMLRSNASTTDLPTTTTTDTEDITRTAPMYVIMRCCRPCLKIQLRFLSLNVLIEIYLVPAAE